MARPFEFNREKTLHKATLLFWEKGYGATSPQELTEVLNLSRSSLYNSFNSKRALFTECLNYYIETESQGMTDFLSSMPPGPGSIKLLLNKIVEANLAGRKPQGCLVVNTAIELGGSDSEIKKIVQQNLDDVIGKLTRYIKEGQRAGKINRGISAEKLATTLFHQITAIRVTARVIRNRQFFDDTISALITLFKTKK